MHTIAADMTREDRPPPRWEYRAEAEISPTGEFAFTQPDPVLARRLGYPLEKFNSPGGWLTWTVPEDVERTKGQIQTLLEGEVWQGRARARAVTGEILIIEMQCTPTRRADGTISVVLEGRDVTEVAYLETELAARESRLRLLGKEIGTAMWSTDEALRFTWSAGPALEALGFAENALVGISLFELLSTEDVNHPAIAAHHQALKGESAAYEVGWQERTWRGLLEPLHDPLSRIVGAVGVAVDLGLLMDATRARRGKRGAERHSFPRNEAEEDLSPLQLGDFLIDPERFEVSRHGKQIPVTVIDFKLLTEFARRPGRVLTRRELVERVWGHDFYGDSASLTMAISRLREKIEDDHANPTIIQTVRGVGYRSGQ